MLNYLKDNFIAIYGAIVASISLIWLIMGFFRDRPKVKIKTRENYKILSKIPNPLYDKNKTYFVLSAINKGRRSIKIISAGAMLFKVEKRGLIFTDSFLAGDRILTESNPTTDFVCEQSLLDLENVKYFFVEDATGKQYKLYRKKIDKILDFFIKK